MAEKELSKSVELLASIFFGKPKEQVFDIPALFYKQRCKDMSFPDINSKDCIYGEFLHTDKLKNICEDLYFDKREYSLYVDEFRRTAIRQIIFDIDPDWLTDEEHTSDYIESVDISDFIQLVSKTRIRSDWDIKKNKDVIFHYVKWASKDYNETKEVVVETSMSNDELVDMYGLEELEKKTRKEWILEEYHDYIDRINLTKLKLLFRDHLWNQFIPKWWQRDFLIDMRRFNYLVWSRRSGKTFLIAYLMARQLQIPNQIIIAVVPILKVQARVLWRYIIAMLRYDTNVSANRWDRVIMNRINGSEIQFLSGERDLSVRAPSANLLVFDEAAFLSEIIFETSSPLVRTTNGIVVATTTVNIDVPKNWFYYRLVDAEISKYDLWSEKYWVRIPLPENPFIPDREKARIIEDGKLNQHIFNCEWMCEFSDQDAFDLKRFWVIDANPLKFIIDGKIEMKFRFEALQKESQYYERFVIGYDSAKLSDQTGISVLGLKKDWWADVIASHQISSYDYIDVVSICIAIRKLLWENKTAIVIEYNNAWVVVEELFRRLHGINVSCITSVWGDQLDRETRYWKVGKKYLVGRLKANIARWMLRGFTFQDRLRLEFETYDENTYSQWRSDWHHFDILSSIMVANIYADEYWYMNIKDETEKEKVKDRMYGMFPEWTTFFGSKERWDFDRFRSCWF